jgi:hypothetical protein
MACFKVLFSHLLGWTEERHENVNTTGLPAKI